MCVCVCVCVCVGSEPIAPVSQQEASTALHSLFHEGMNPSDLISVEQLHALSGVSKHYQDPATVRRRPHSAAVHAPSPGQVCELCTCEACSKTCVCVCVPGIRPMQHLFVDQA